MSEHAPTNPRFIAAVTALPDAYADRLDDESLYVVRTALGAGEWQEGLEELTVRLAQRGATVTQTERDELARLYQTTGLDTDLLDELTVRTTD